MHFNHYGGEAARLAADLVNLTAPPLPEHLEPLLAAHGVVRRTLTAAQAGTVWTWSRRLAVCFGPQDLEERCGAVNALLADASSSPRISLHDGQPHLHYSATGSDVAAHVRAVTAAGLAYVVCSAGAERLGRCARRGCGLAFVDTSRNGRRAYCSVRCANNDAVARHRERRQGERGSSWRSPSPPGEEGTTGPGGRSTTV
ncbi:CGNR zinc finger domain-containing protein [Streptomyces sp. NPDC050504]|uniref:CGNR zinc finger domain-containing protein n=1 Tax=Streptomyces sp. NPDC050504 TaxID=3365618 RepID=UPI00378FE58C